MKTKPTAFCYKIQLRRYILIGVLFLLSLTSNAGWKAWYCNYGGSYRYQVWVEIDKYDIHFLVWHPICAHYDHGKTWAAANCSADPYAAVAIRRGSSPYTLSYNRNWQYFAGSAFTPPATIPSDTIGVARSEISAEESITSIGNETTVILQNFSGALSAAANTRFGSAYRTIIWKKDYAYDSILTPQKVLWDGGIRIENGQVISLGNFQLSDFETINEVDSLGYEVIKVKAKPALTKTIIMNFPNSDSLVTVTTAGDVGFGSYDQAAIFQPLQTFTIPTLSHWGIIILSLLLLFVAIVFIRR